MAVWGPVRPKREEIRITNTGSVCVSNLSPTIRITGCECKTKFGFGIRRNGRGEAGLACTARARPI